MKLYYPFDDIKRHPRSITEPTAQVVDWGRWAQLQNEFDNRDTVGGKLGKGNEIKVKEVDVFHMTQDQLDEYMDWYEKTWVQDGGKEDEGDAFALIYPSVY